MSTAHEPKTTISGVQRQTEQEASPAKPNLNHEE